MGLKHGKNCQISPLARFYGDIEVGDNVRIDDFCFLSGNIKIGSHIHISVNNILSGKFGIEIEDFCQFAVRGTFLTACDDFTGEALVGPCIPEKFKKVKTGKIIIKKHAVFGVGCTVLPDVTIGEGAAIGVGSLIKCDVPEWKIFAGVPARLIGERRKDMLDLEKQFLEEYNAGK